MHYMNNYDAQIIVNLITYRKWDRDCPRSVICTITVNSLTKTSIKNIYKSLYEKHKFAKLRSPVYPMKKKHAQSREFYVSLHHLILVL